MGGAAAHGLMRTVAMLPMGPSQRVAIVEVGNGEDRRWLVLGLTAQHMSTLHTMAPQGEPVEMKGVDFADTPFGQMLAKLKGKAEDK
jgi:flagellar protein FliO/FliZ